MTNHPGDYNSFLRLAQLREESIEAHARRPAARAQARPVSAVRRGVAGLLRAAADRLDNRRSAPRPDHHAPAAAR